MLNFVSLSNIEREREREREREILQKKENRLYFVECLLGLL